MEHTMKTQSYEIGMVGLGVMGRNLGPGWVGFNFKKAFDRPVKIVNDAAMQALGISWFGHGTRFRPDR
jgi:predicted NBD/HSP70 family sugar kinase